MIPLPRSLSSLFIFHQVRAFVRETRQWPPGLPVQRTEADAAGVVVVLYQGGHNDGHKNLFEKADGGNERRI